MPDGQLGDGHARPVTTAGYRRKRARPRSGQAVYLVDVAAGHAERGVVGADGWLVRPVKQAVDPAVGVVVQLDLAHAELVGPGVARVVGDLRDRLSGQLQILVKIHEPGHGLLLSCRVVMVSAGPPRPRLRRPR